MSLTKTTICVYIYIWREKKHWHNYLRKCFFFLCKLMMHSLHKAHSSDSCKFRSRNVKISDKSRPCLRFFRGDAMLSVLVELWSCMMEVCEEWPAMLFTIYSSLSCSSTSSISTSIHLSGLSCNRLWEIFATLLLLLRCSLPESELLDWPWPGVTSPVWFCKYAASSSVTDNRLVLFSPVDKYL